MNLPLTPAEAGYRMPAEWEPQEAVWLAWPHNLETWPGDTLVEVRETYREVVGHLSVGQEVRLLVNDAASEEDARRLLVSPGVDDPAISFFRVATRDAWIRDYGPTFVVDPVRRRRAMVSWVFNAWGLKYPDFLPDNDVPGILADLLGVPAFEPGIVLEGGSIDVNGAGMVLTTEQCLLNSNRNPGLGRRDLEAVLCGCLGVREVVWLGDGIVGDDTDGHVDDIARFVSPDTVVCAREADPRDDNYALLEDNFRRLTAFRDAAGRSLQIVELPMPGPQYSGAGRLPASYANFYVGNRTVLVPVFDDPADRVAVETIGRCFPGRATVGIDCRALLLGLGTLHCCSQQEPALTS